MHFIGGGVGHKEYGSFMTERVFPNDHQDGEELEQDDLTSNATVTEEEVKDVVFEDSDESAIMSDSDISDDDSESIFDFS